MEDRTAGWEVAGFDSWDRTGTGPILLVKNGKWRQRIYLTVARPVLVNLVLVNLHNSDIFSGFSAVARLALLTRLKNSKKKNACYAG